MDSSTLSDPQAELKRLTEGAVKTKANKNKTAKQLVKSVHADAVMYKSQIHFQTTYNIKCAAGYLGYAFSEKEAWEKAAQQLEVQA